MHEPAERGPELPEEILPDTPGGHRVDAQQVLHKMLDPGIHDPPQLDVGGIEGVVQVEYEKRSRPHL